MNRITTTLTVLLLGCSLASTAAAQWSIQSSYGSSASRGAQQPFKGLSSTGQGPSYSIDAQQNGPGVLSVPQVMPVVRGRRDPVRVVFDTKKIAAAEDKVLTRLDARRRALVRQLRKARTSRDSVGANKAMRALETLRQQRLERLRSIAPPQIVSVQLDVPLPFVPDPAAPAPAKDDKPILPIPTRPGGAARLN